MTIEVNTQQALLQLLAATEVKLSVSLFSRLYLDVIDSL